MSSLSTSFSNTFSTLPTWQKVVVAIGGALTFSIVTYGSYFLYNYRQLFTLSGYKKPSLDYSDYSIKKREFRVRVIDLDGAMFLQKDLMEKYKPEIIRVPEMGPGMRIDCSFRQFWNYEKALRDQVGSETDDDAEGRPLITFYGSNDFHHLTLPLVRRFRTPFNIVIFDNHPDWFRFYPGLHCGCWFTHVCSLPTVQQAFHLGGDSGEFEEKWGFHPWTELKSGKLAVFPTRSIFKQLQWPQVKQTKLREDWKRIITEEYVRKIFEPYSEQLKKYPLYITLDKDCMYKPDNYQNWNSGVLSRNETLMIIEVLIDMSGGRLLAMDVTGEFTKVNVKGIYRTYLHNSSHDDEQNNQDMKIATRTNQDTNMALMKMLSRVLQIPDQN